MDRPKLELELEWRDLNKESQAGRVLHALWRISVSIIYIKNSIVEEHVIILAYLAYKKLQILGVK